MTSRLSAGMAWTAVKRIAKSGKGVLASISQRLQPFLAGEREVIPGVAYSDPALGPPGQGLALGSSQHCTSSEGVMPAVAPPDADVSDDDILRDIMLTKRKVRHSGKGQVRGEGSGEPVEETLHGHEGQHLQGLVLACPPARGLRVFLFMPPRSHLLLVAEDRGPAAVIRIATDFIACLAWLDEWLESFC